MLKETGKPTQETKNTGQIKSDVNNETPCRCIIDQKFIGNISNSD